MTPLAPAHGRAPALARPSRPAAAPRPPRRARLGVAAAAQQQAGDGAAAAAAASADPQQQQQQQQQQQAGAQAPGPEGEKGARSRSSSWGAVESGGGRGGGADYLYELGKSDYNTNVDAGQNVAHIDYLFTGNTLGHKTDIADGSLRGYEFRTFENIQGDYFIAPRFLEKVAVHVVKTYLVDSGALDPAVRVPLILGIWGPKGCGKTFQLELAFKKLGVEAVVMSAGELESDIAGKPGRLIRERYRKASNMGKVRGRLTALVINDIDAGLGHFANTQITVNNQIVVGTLMNICDTPTQVSISQDWREGDFINRVPIIVTGNDFSTLFAPLVRDGRMDKFFWCPAFEDKVEIVHQMYRDDGLPRDDVVDRTTFDSDKADFSDLHRRLVKGADLPQFEPVTATLAALVAEGERLVAEQDAVNANKLSEEYLKHLAAAKKRRGVGIGLSG
ncbi:ribulose bisphosphate carboxylase oxygenase, chloroplastic [Raphidocelis subcapitata]|uniref:Ribulose bisphosphate carboxylase/oxygenase activase, chloroplastic n=1 Tax=Raphidocelis subcapitata TaxID=307507 RepID=A0A2V0PJ24_9CHLO|nr:ribulose bisphosphate carboxylase oxygenase, chloroplastic [Raphidocelis subcapitata]|eukprot:GBF99559.1 ribulose bisphosphate carboxylase oxygenase, chloroplastic [Raphidocelis subcapitata]